MSLAVSIGGMLVTALLLGLVSDAIGEKVDDLKKGKSSVLETDHMLIIGYASLRLFIRVQQHQNVLLRCCLSPLFLPSDLFSRGVPFSMSPPICAFLRWSDKIYMLVMQLCMGKDNLGGGSVRRGRGMDLLELN